VFFLIKDKLVSSLLIQYTFPIFQNVFNDNIYIRNIVQYSFCVIGTSFGYFLKHYSVQRSSECDTKILILI